MQEKMLMKKEKLNLFEKISRFFRGIFYKRQNKNAINSGKPYIEKQGTLDILKKEQEILNLQMKYENGEIKESDLSDKEKEELAKLYKAQIKTLEENIFTYKNKLNNYKEKIIKIKNNNITKR